VNTQKVESLIEVGKMSPAGLEKFRNRAASKSGVYSFEQQSIDFDAPAKQQFRESREAWSFFQAQPPSYRKKATWWVVSARRSATRQKRLATLIAKSMQQQRL
jgi:uncharacterized protein YdeI (YjbR/CyaY-like superfamily)